MGYKEDIYLFALKKQDLATCGFARKNLKNDKNLNLKGLSTPTHVLIHHSQPPNSEKMFLYSLSALSTKISQVVMVIEFFPLQNLVVWCSGFLVLYGCGMFPLFSFVLFHIFPTLCYS